MSTRIALALALALAPATALAGGTITGKVDATPAKYLADTIVFVKGAPPRAKPITAQLDQKGMAFVPRVLILQVGDSVRFLNHDKVDHNVFSADIDPYNLGMMKADASATRAFTKPGVYSQLCSIHPEMLAYVYVGENPYAAMVDKDGRFALKDVPAGSWQVGVWNPKLKAADRPVTVAEGKAEELTFSLKR